MLEAERRAAERSTGCRDAPTRSKPYRAAGGSRSARRCWSTTRPASCAPTGSRASAPTSRRSRRTAARSSSSPRARSRSAAASWGSRRSSLPLEQSQAAASAGQIALSQGWPEGLSRHGIVAGQILITPNITEERRYFLNARTTITTLLGLGAVPIINENDTVATAEIRYGDNDRLSARVATMIEADCLVLLSDVDGLYTAPPGKDASATICRTSRRSRRRSRRWRAARRATCRAAA